MTAVDEPTAPPEPPPPPADPVGFGRMHRKEDARFVRGRGNYVDDIVLPGMLHGAILRSTYAHARIRSIDTSAAEAHPKVRAVITGAILETLGLAWAPSLSHDVIAILATDKVRYQGQEVAFVVADDRYAARDALELIEVDYEPLPPVMDARKALDPGAPVIRDDIEGKTDNHIFDWESGDKDATDAVFAAADVVVVQDMLYPRVHPAPMETCGQISDMDKVTGKLTIYCTTQAPHAHRTVYALVAGLPEHQIRVVSPDIGGGFGNKVGVYPGYVLTVVGSIVTGKPVKWMEDRSENLMSTSFARDYHMHGEIAATRDGKITGLRVKVLADHGAFNNTAQPGKFPAGFFHIFTGSYDLEAAHCEVTGVYSNKAPGGVAYACSFRVTEAAYLVERMVDCLADEMGRDPAELRMQNLLKPEQFPYVCATGWEYDSGDYPRALQVALDLAGYPALRAEQAARRERGDGSLMGIGLSFFTESVGAGPRKHMDILGLGMADGAELRVHPTGKAVVRISVQSQGQGHETTFAQIVAEELGIPVADIDVVHGDTDNTPFGLGTYGSRSTPVSGAAVAIATRRVRDKAKLVAAAMLEVAPDDLEWEKGKWFVRGDPSTAKTIAEIAMAAHSSLELPDGVEGHLDGSCVYDPPNLTFPFGAYICVVDVDAGTGQVKVRRFIAVDDCGPRINPMIVEGQVHGGLADGVGMALMQVIAFDEDGNCLGGSFMDYLLPTSMECPSWELGETVTPSPHHPLGVKGVGESATVGSPAAVVNAVLDAIGVRHADMPLTPSGCGGPCRAAPSAPTWPSRERSRSVFAGAQPCASAKTDQGWGGPLAVNGPLDLVQTAVDRLRAERRGFVAATVVRADRPTSAKPGDRAVVLDDGSMVGFVGGECARASVQLHALAALAAGEPRLLRIRPDAEAVVDADPDAAAAGADPDESGTVTVHNPCLSGGMLEIFLEPEVPPGLALVFGDGPIARAVGELATWLGFTVEPWAPGAVVDGVVAVVVASHGGDEQAVLQDALAAGAPYIGLVASPRRAAAVLATLDVSDADRARISTPAGLDIGSRTPPEVALSILAEVVARRPRGRGPVALAVSPPPDRVLDITVRTAVDPVCGMTVATLDSSRHVDHGGIRYWFCGAGCEGAFRTNPAAFVG